MKYHELESAVAHLDGELATVRLRRDPSRDFLAEIEYCAERDGVGYVYLFLVDRRTLAYSEGLARVKVADILDLRKSGIAVEDRPTAHPGGDWETTLHDPQVFPQPPERSQGQ